MNVEWRQVATDPRPSQTTSLLKTVRKTAKLHFVNCKLKVKKATVLVTVKEKIFEQNSKILNTYWYK